MNIFYEESGQFKVASVVQKNNTTYQVDTLHGKRTKVKVNNVFTEFDGALVDFMDQAQAGAAEIDTDLLWEVCGDAEFSAADLAAEYFGHAPSALELAATLMALYAAPIYFYKKGKGVFKAAPEETIKQALATQARKQAQEAQIEQWVDVLVGGEMPSEIAVDLKSILHAPDKQALTYKAFTKAAERLKITPLALARQIGGVASIPQYLQDGFEVKHFPTGTVQPDLALPQLYDLPKAEVRAFSIDDESTTEIDDALSVQSLPDGGRRVGIHIAAPALAVVPDGEIEQAIMRRLSTVYFPGGKITMLPDNWIAAFSLDEGGYRPAVSIYFDVDAEGNVGEAHTQIEAVWVENNLRIQAIEPFFNHSDGLDVVEEAFAHHHDLAWLYRFAIGRQKARGKYEPDRPIQYDYGIELGDDGVVSISVRERGSPIDTLVSEMMILANSTWAQMLDAAGLPGLFRVQPTGKVRMSTQSEPHVGMGVAHYGWFTSPLRRAADYINQRQLLHLIDADRYAVRYQSNDAALFAALRDFESAYAAYADFQRQMESYWSLVYIQQQGLGTVQARLLKDELVRIEGMPLVAKAVGVPIDALPKSRMQLAVAEVDPDRQYLALTYQKALPLE